MDLGLALEEAIATWSSTAKVYYPNKKGGKREEWDAATMRWSPGVQPGLAASLIVRTVEDVQNAVCLAVWTMSSEGGREREQEILHMLLVTWELGQLLHCKKISPY